MDNRYLYSQLDDFADELRARFDDSVASGNTEVVYPNNTTVKFVKDFGNITAGTKAIVVDRQKGYYALTVRGGYVEAVHSSFLKRVI